MVIESEVGGPIGGFTSLDLTGIEDFTSLKEFSAVGSYNISMPSNFLFITSFDKLNLNSLETLGLYTVGLEEPFLINNTSLESLTIFISIERIEITNNANLRSLVTANLATDAFILKNNPKVNMCYFREQTTIPYAEITNNDQLGYIYFWGDMFLPSVDELVVKDNANLSAIAISGAWARGIYGVVKKLTIINNPTLDNC